MNVNDQAVVTELQKYTEEGQNNLRPVHDSVKYINNTSYSSSINVNLSATSLTDMNVNGQVTVAEPHDYTKE